jgi:hypothetical protein
MRPRSVWFHIADDKGIVTLEGAPRPSIMLSKRGAMAAKKNNSDIPASARGTFVWGFIVSAEYLVAVLYNPIGIQTNATVKNFAVYP